MQQNMQMIDPSQIFIDLNMAKSNCSQKSIINKG